MVAKATDIEKAFNVFRPEGGQEKIDDNKVRKILKESDNSERCEEAGRRARRSGQSSRRTSRNWCSGATRPPTSSASRLSRAAALSERQDGDDILKLFDELDKLTSGPFAKAKADLDERISKKFSLKVEALRPWHYQDLFFQETPAVFKADLDEPFKTADLEKLTGDSYKGIGPAGGRRAGASSDMKPKKARAPQRVRTDIDRRRRRSRPVQP